MMIWNYRIFREDDGDYVIREVFYEMDGSILGCTKDAVEPVGHSVGDLAKQIEWFKEALTLPVLTLADVPCSPAPKKVSPASAANLSRKQLMAELELA